jgi:hypothetical protein
MRPIAAQDKADLKVGLYDCELSAVRRITPEAVAWEDPASRRSFQ